MRSVSNFDSSASARAPSVGTSCAVSIVHDGGILGSVTVRVSCANAAHETEQHARSVTARMTLNIVLRLPSKPISSGSHVSAARARTKDEYRPAHCSTIKHRSTGLGWRAWISAILVEGLWNRRKSAPLSE